MQKKTFKAADTHLAGHAIFSVSNATRQKRFRGSPNLSLSGAQRSGVHPLQGSDHIMARKNLKTPPLFLWLALPSTLRQRNSKSKVSLWKRIRCFCPHYAGGIWKRWFFSEKVSNIFRQHCAGGIWKSNNHQSICVWGKIRSGKSRDNSRDVIVFESFGLNTNWKSAFSISSVWEPCSISSVFVTD